MSAQIIDPQRYKKTTRKEVEEKKKNNKIRYSTKKKKENDLKYKKKKLDKIKKEKKKLEKDKEKTIKKEQQYTKVKKNKVYIPTFVKVCIVIVLIVAIGFLSRKIVSFENMPILSVFSNKESKVELENDYNLKLGISKLDTTDVLATKNIVLNELNLFSSNQLIKINNKYEIEYDLATKIEKVNNKEYLVYLDTNLNKGFECINNSIQKITKNKDNNVYYKNIENIKEVAKENDYIRFSLKEDDPYFIYKLDFPLSENTIDTMYQINSKNENKINFLRTNSDSKLKNISLTNYTDTDDMVKDFRDDKLDMFFASSDSIMQLIGKHEYNVKKYRDGENLFLFGNKNSELYKLTEVRKALAYSIKREDIIKEVNNSFSELIDLPFIYSDIKYKYDIYGAENELLSNGWKKENGVYTKEINGAKKKLELNFLVNDEDSVKKKVAENIKKMAQNVGIKININKVKSKDFEKNLKDKKYDIILADVYINQYPDIRFLNEYVNINDNINNAFEAVNNSKDKEELEKNITALQDTMSSEIACIGILARNTNMVYQKYITGFDYTNYMMIFNNLNNIGKIVKNEE